MFEKNLKDQRGFSLYLGVVMLSLILAIALIISNLFLIRMQLSRDILSSVAAFYGADSALECAQLEISKQTNNNPGINCSDLRNVIMNACSAVSMSNTAGSDPEPGIVTGGVVCDGTNSNITSMTSSGEFRGTKRSIRVDF